MDKKIKLGPSSIMVFILNIIIFIASIFLKRFYTGLGYYPGILDVTFIINIILLLVCILFNIYILIKDAIPLKKVIISAAIICIFYSIVNFGLVFFANKKYNSSYSRINQKLIIYCKEYYCNKYETFNLKNKRKFSLEKKYRDYNNETQLIKINVIYNKQNIEEIESIIYSSNESYSSYLIKEQLSLYLSNFNIEIEEKKIDEAFKKRDNNIKYENILYEVKGVYKRKNLEGFKTKIKISL